MRQNIRLIKEKTKYVYFIQATNKHKMKVFIYEWRRNIVSLIYKNRG